MKIDTSTALLIKYQSPTPLLSDVAVDYLPHLKPAEYRRKARRAELPFPVFKIDTSTKAPYYVHITALAKWIDSQQAIAAKDYDLAH